MPNNLEIQQSKTPEPPAYPPDWQEAYDSALTSLWRGLLNIFGRRYDKRRHEVLTAIANATKDKEKNNTS